MKPYFILASLLTAAMFTSSVTQAAPVLVDGFESANLSAPNGPTPAVNTNGFRWADTNYTSIVGMVNGQPTRVWSGTATSDIWTGHDFTCYTNTYCLRFRYPAGQYMSEQRFDIGTPRTDIWLRYWLRVPTNFTHPSSTPNNQKFLAIWMDGYEGQGDGPTAWLSFFHNGSGGSTLGFTYSTGQHTGAIAYQQEKPFISVPADRGRWMQIVFHVKAATNRTSNDGVIETWRRWSNESNFTKLHEIRNANIAPPPAGPNGWKAGYLMGWANAAYPVETEWLLDDFTIALDSLVTGSTATNQSPPTAPTLQVSQ